MILQVCVCPQGVGWAGTPLPGPGTPPFPGPGTPSRDQVHP